MVCVRSMLARNVRMNRKFIRKNVVINPDGLEQTIVKKLFPI